MTVCLFNFSTVGCMYFESNEPEITTPFPGEKHLLKICLVFKAYFFFLLYKCIRHAYFFEVELALVSRFTYIVFIVWFFVFVLL